MAEVILNLKSFIQALTFTDIIFLSLIVILIILFITMLYLIRNTEDQQINDLWDEEGELLDLKAITEQIEAEDNQDHGILSEYETLQEENAIISYDELLSNTKSLKINYEDDYGDDDVKIRKVELTETNQLEDEKKSLSTISYEKEEAFLEALKKLQKNI